MSFSSTSLPNGLRLTRITNACVLIELAEYAVLTDPWFRNPWGFNEDPGIQIEDLPRLDAVIGSHFAPDHWGVDDLHIYKYLKTTNAYTATNAMAKRASKIGFQTAECLQWSETREIASGLTLEVVEAQSFFGRRSNNYILSNGDIRIFFGGETRRLEPLQNYRNESPSVDVAIVPTNGMHLLGYKLVTSAKEGLEAAKILGASIFVPIHDSMHSMGFGGPTSSAEELRSYADGTPQILFLEAGQQTEVTLESTAVNPN